MSASLAGVKAQAAHWSRRAGREMLALQPSCHVQPGQDLLLLSPPALQAGLWLSPVLLGWELAVFT